MNATTEKRSLGLAGASNFRDLGGYRGVDGKQVVWKKLFRSNNLSDLTPNDTQVVHALKVNRSYDFRGENERLAAPYAVKGLTHHSLSIEPTVVQRMHDMLAAGNTVTPAIAVALMQETYRGFVLDNSHRFAQLFQAMLNSDDPLVFHCTAGKDRTGFAAALILHSLGVSASDIMADYMLTNVLYQRADLPTTTVTPLEALKVIWQVQPAFLQAAFNAVNAQWGSLDTYLVDALKVGKAEQAELRARYLMV